MRSALHAVAYDVAGTPISGRLLPDGHIGRMAVRQSARGSGIGGALLQVLMAQARARGDKQVVLERANAGGAVLPAPRLQRVDGEEFFEAGIAHIQMQLTFA